MTFEGTQGPPGGAALGLATAAPAFVGTGPFGSPAAWTGTPVGTVGLPMGAALGVLGMPIGRFAPMEAVAPTAVPRPVLAPYQNTPDVEARAANDFMQAACADLIRKLYQYLETNAPQHRQLAECVPLVAHAAELYGAGDYTAAFSQAYQAYRAITIQRSSVPTLPSLE